jgi:hypothetical protein
MMTKNTGTIDLKAGEWAQAGDKAREAAGSVGEMASHATSAIVGMASNTAQNVVEKADNLTAQAGSGLRSLGDKLSDDGLQQGMFGNASQAVAKKMHDSGDYIDRAKLSGMTTDVADLIRRYPISSMLVGVGLGCLAARMWRR